MASNKNKGQKSSKTRRDTAVQGTNDSSIVSKCSAAEKGYFDDNFLKYFVAKRSRRAPLINRGYYIRAQAMQHIFNIFLKAFPGIRKQVLVLGAGFDSAYFRLKQEGMLMETKYIELDFPAVVKRKAALIKHQEALWSEIKSSSSKPLSENIAIHTEDYVLVGADLTDLVSTEPLLRSVVEDVTAPTLIISEVVLAYLSPEKADDVIAWTAKIFSNSLFATYEQILPEDAFGRVMVDHFVKIGSPLKSLTTYPTITSQAERYIAKGWHFTVASDMNHFYHHMLSSEECQRMNQLEPFDEYEEWVLKCSHYILLTAARGDCESLLSITWPEPSPKSVLSLGDYVQMGTTVCSRCLTGELKTQSVYEPKTFISLLPDNLQPNLEEQDNSSEVGVAAPPWSSTDQPSLQYCSRFAHCSVRLNSSTVLLIGGFGHTDAGHGRTKYLMLLDTDIGKIRQVVTRGQDGEPVLMEMMHHSATLLSPGTVLLFGGRTSPIKGKNDLMLLELPSLQDTASPASTLGEHTLRGLDSDEDDTRCHVRTLSTLGVTPCERWRHSAVLVQKEGVKYMVVFGGCNQGGKTLGDGWILNTSTWRWKQLDNNRSNVTPSARMSHTADVWGRFIVVTSGLGECQRPLADVWLLDSESWFWKKLQINGELLPRFSHTSDIILDQLILVGGVSPYHPTPSVSIINLQSGNCQYLSMPASPERPLMLHGHSMHPFTPGHWLLLGGGGNCFSFGTHLNSMPQIMSLPL